MLVLPYPHASDTADAEDEAARRPQKIDVTDRILPFCESFGVSRIHHILRVHGHTILHEKEAAKIFDDARKTLSRIY